MKKLLFLLLFFMPIRGLCCEEVEVKEIFSFYNAKYVFTGKIVSKVYAKDSLTYVITFDVFKHYKKVKTLPQNIKMKFESEGEYTGIFDSCEKSFSVGEEWLVYANKNKAIPSFYYMGINSRRIEENPITRREKLLFEKGKSFNMRKYIFEHETPFNYCENITSIDSVLKTAKVKYYPKDFTVLSCFINKKGKLKSVKVERGIIKVTDSVFNLIIKVEDKKNYPISEFEKDAIKIIGKVKRWQIKKYSSTGVAVPYLKHIFIYCDFESRKWGYWL